MTPAQKRMRTILMHGRPRDVHPHTWLRLVAEKHVTRSGDYRKRGNPDQEQAWRGRVSTVYHRLLRQCGVVVEGA